MQRRHDSLTKNFSFHSILAAVPFMGIPTAQLGAGMRLPGQPQTGAVLLVSNLNEQVHTHVTIAT